MKKLNFLFISIALWLYSCSQESEGQKAGKDLCACLEKGNGDRHVLAECQKEFDTKYNDKAGDSKFAEDLKKEALPCMTKAQNSIK